MTLIPFNWLREVTDDLRAVRREQLIDEAVRRAWNRPSLHKVWMRALVADPLLCERRDYIEWVVCAEFRSLVDR